MSRKPNITGIAVMILAIMLFSSCKSTDMRLLYWNIQNGMWDGQNDNYGRFVEWVKAQDPDVCVWCEAQSIWETDSDKAMDPQDRFLEKGWGELAARYGHQYWGIGGHRDNYPQVITSKYPITYVDKIIGEEPDSVVTHGCGWATIEIAGEKVNIVTLHTWPQQYAFRAEDIDASKAEFGGDHYREREMKYICEHTILSEKDAQSQNWLMMGDFNSRSRVDKDYYDYPEDSPKYLVHDYIRNNTPYIDIIKEKYPERLTPSTGAKNSRIDFVYATRPMYDRITFADIIWDEYTTPVRDPQNLSNFWRPSDHLPIIVDFRMK